MPFLYIHIRNSAFCARDDGAQFDSPEAALALGVQGALDMVAGEIDQGRQSAAIVVNIEEEDGTRLLSSVVAVSVSSLIVSETAPRDHA